MNLTQLKKRKLDEFLVMINIIKMEVNVEYEDRVCKKNFYLFVGIDMLGKKKYLTYGINYREDTEFWLQRFKDIKRRSIEDVLYITSSDIKQMTRAAQLIFKDVRIVESPFELIERVSQYFPVNYRNKIPTDIRNLYISKDIKMHKEELAIFYDDYNDIKILKLLLKDRLNDIEKNYDISYNLRELIFAYYFIRDIKMKLKVINNKLKVINDVDVYLNEFLDVIISQEKQMMFNKKRWLDIIDELCEKEVVRKYL